MLCAQSASPPYLVARHVVKLAQSERHGKEKTGRATLKFGGWHRAEAEKGGVGEGGAKTFPQERILLASQLELYLLRKGPFSPEREEDESQDSVAVSFV
jgi:hypothetical protein